LRALRLACAFRSFSAAAQIAATRLGFVRARASKYSLCSRTGGDVPLRGFQHGQHRHGAAEELESAAIGGNVLVVAGARAEEVAEFIASATEPGGRSGAFEAPHGPVATFDAAVILLQPVVQVGTGPMPHILAELGADRPGVAVVAVGRDPVWCDAGDRLGGAEERLRALASASRPRSSPLPTR
jgi:hypothetical protein